MALSPRDRAINKVLVATKYRFIGDTLLAVPLIRAIASQWPDAEIILLTGASAHELLKGCPYVGDTICFDPYRKADEGFRRFHQIVRQVRQHEFDLAFVCNRSFHSALIARLGNIPERVGWSGFQKRDFLLTRTVPYNNKAPEIQSYLDLISPFASNAVSTSPDRSLELWITDVERNAIAEKLPNLIGRAVIGLQPGATHAEKRWPAHSYAEWMREMYARNPCTTFLLLGGPEEADTASDLLDLCCPDVRRNAVPLVGRLSLRETCAALLTADVFLAGDTAVRHAAMALQTPTVALFGPTSAKKWGNADPPAHVVLVAPERDLSGIGVAEVLAATDAALTNGRSGSAGRPKADRLLIS